jgi:hypothetical protein
LPLRYTTPKTVEPAKVGTEVHCAGVNIRTPKEGEEATVTFYFEVYEGALRVHSQPVTVKAADLIAGYAEGPATHASLKKIAYEEARKLFGAGGTVS